MLEIPRRELQTIIWQAGGWRCARSAAPTSSTASGHRLDPRCTRRICASRVRDRLKSNGRLSRALAVPDGHWRPRVAQPSPACEKLRQDLAGRPGLPSATSVSGSVGHYRSRVGLPIESISHHWAYLIGLYGAGQDLLSRFFAWLFRSRHAFSTLCLTVTVHVWISPTRLESTSSHRFSVTSPSCPRGKPTTSRRFCWPRLSGWNRNGKSILLNSVLSGHKT